MTLGKINLWRFHVRQALACCLSERRPVSLLTLEKALCLMSK
jgi:hypothetical protein